MGCILFKASFSHLFKHWSDMCKLVMARLPSGGVGAGICHMEVLADFVEAIPLHNL